MKNFKIMLDNYCNGSYYYNINIARAIIERR
nr:MAG TPA: hypothetical protein [Bacteriophage sp.]